MLLPSPAVATPEAFAARAALAEALASPRTALPALVTALRESGSKRSAAVLGRLGKAIEATPAAERRTLAKQAAALRRGFDGAFAAPGEAVDLGGLPTRVAGRKKTMKEYRQRLLGLQELLAASKDRAVLVILQGMDTAGKDGVIKGPLGLNVGWTRVASFKKPSPKEAAHDFLWRIKPQVPAKGIIGVFNRSHYEDILDPSVYGTLPKETVEARYRRIVEFERSLAEAGVVVVKIFLHISKAEQGRRLRDRLADPTKRWKFSLSDLETRKRWDAFQRVYAEVLARTSTLWAPWHVVAADDKPGRDATVSRLLFQTLAGLGLEYPDRPELAGVVISD